MEVVASLSQGRTAAAQCGLFTHKSVPVIFEPPCISFRTWHHSPSDTELKASRYESLYLEVHIVAHFDTTKHA